MIDNKTKIKYNNVNVNVKRLQVVILKEKRILLKDIALKAGLTINTVSRALNDKNDISDKTKAYVQALANEMGYIPDVVASSLRSGVTKTIGIVFDNINNPYFMMMTDLIYRELSEMGYDIMIYTNSGDHAKFDLLSFQKMVARRIDGIITFLKPTEEVVKSSKLNQIPVVILGREGDDVGIDSVYTDDCEGGEVVAKHLYEKGYHNVSYIGAPKDILTSLKRFEGFQKYYQSKDMMIKKENIIFLEHGNLKLQPFVDRLIQNKVRAIFCFNDTMAFEVIDYLQKQNIKVPQDIAVCGYDNLEEYLHIPVMLTTVDTNKKELVRKTIQILSDRLKDFHQPIQKMVNASRLMIRKTT
jgi:LacI family transcriptional regulator